MRRCADTGGKTHFLGDSGRTLCGKSRVVEDLFHDKCDEWPITTDRVTCEACARLYCQIKNSPWNEVEAEVLSKATYAAVENEQERK